MEPDSHKNFSGPEEPHKVALVSIAISLKRIADAMQEPNDYGEIGGAAIAGAISRSLQDR